MSCAQVGLGHGDCFFSRHQPRERLPPHNGPEWGGQDSTSFSSIAQCLGGIHYIFTYGVGNHMKSNEKICAKTYNFIKNAHIFSWAFIGFCIIIEPCLVHVYLSSPNILQSFHIAPCVLFRSYLLLWFKYCRITGKYEAGTWTNNTITFDNHNYYVMKMHV